MPVTKIHTGMRRCLLNVDGTVNYFLDPTDSTKKADGTSADLTGADGQVMVQIPKFYYRYGKTGNVHAWEISDKPLLGYTLHPAFVKAGVEVDYRYYGAYDACYLDATDGLYKSGLNLDDITSSLDLANDKLGSVSGIYPLVGNTIVESRTLASNIGTGWHQLDYYLMSAVQLLYLVEYGDFDSQAELGDGNTNGSYVGSSANQNDSPHTIAGASNSWGNSSTDDSQPSAGAKPGTAYMSYRGIENFLGNKWDWVDGVFINPTGDTDAWYATNDYDNFSDNTTGKTKIATSMPVDGYVTEIVATAGPVFIPSSTSGGSSSTYLADFFFDDDNNQNRVLRFGGSAAVGAPAGAFSLNASIDASFSNRGGGARLAY